MGLEERIRSVSLFIISQVKLEGFDERCRPDSPARHTSNRDYLNCMNHFFLLPLLHDKSVTTAFIQFIP